MTPESFSSSERIATRPEVQCLTPIVSYVDSDGLKQSVEVNAESLYEAVDSYTRQHGRPYQVSPDSITMSASTSDTDA